MSSFLCNALVFVLSGLILFHFDKNHFSSSSGFTEGYLFKAKTPTWTKWITDGFQSFCELLTKKGPKPSLMQSRYLNCATTILYHWLINWGSIKCCSILDIFHCILHLLHAVYISCCCLEVVWERTLTYCIEEMNTGNGSQTKATQTFKWVWYVQGWSGMNVATLHKLLVSVKSLFLLIWCGKRLPSLWSFLIYPTCKRLVARAEYLPNYFKLTVNLLIYFTSTFVKFFADRLEGSPRNMKTSTIFLISDCLYEPYY